MTAWRDTQADADEQAQVERIRDYIRNGDCYQVNLTQRFEVHARGDTWQAYAELRKLNPAPFSAWSIPKKPTSSKTTANGAASNSPP